MKFHWKSTCNKFMIYYNFFGISILKVMVDVVIKHVMYAVCFLVPYEREKIFIKDLSVSLAGTNVHEQSRSDLCKLRFGSTLVNQLRAFNRATGAPGFLLYNSGNQLSTFCRSLITTCLSIYFPWSPFGEDFHSWRTVTGLTLAVISLLLPLHIRWGNVKRQHKDCRPESLLSFVFASYSRDAFK